MKADKDSLSDFLRTADTIFAIPVFQRNYEWSTKQCLRLFKDLERVAEHEPAYIDHFLGTIVYTEDTDDNLDHIYRIIDGQQRIITVSLLLKALADSDDAMKGKIYSQFLVDQNLSSNNKMKLKPVTQDYGAYHAIIDPKFTYNGNSKIFENYRLFKNLIEDSKYSPSQLVRAFSHLSMVKIVLSVDAPDENPQVIFESLNSTGVALNPSDLVRNLLLMNLNIDKQEKFYKQYWKPIEDSMPETTITDFLYRYMVLKNQAFFSKNQAYSEYKDFFLNSSMSSEDALKDFYKYAQYYIEMLNADSGDKTFDKHLSHINAVGNKIFYPYIMLIMSWLEDGEIEQDQANELMALIENLMFRSKLTKVTGSTLRNLVSRLVKDNDSSMDYKKKFMQDVEDRFPIDKTVSDSMMLYDFSGQQRAFAKVLLEAVDEGYKENKSVEPDVDFIMPLKPTNDWQVDVKNATNIANRYGQLLGNIALVSDDFKMKKHVFSQKQNVYRLSKYQTTKDLAEEASKWDQNSITRRTKTLAQMILKAYPMPKFKEVDRENISGEYLLNQEIDVTGTRPTTLTINYYDYPVDSWGTLLKTLIDYVWNNDSRDFRILYRDPILNKKIFKNKKQPIKLANGHTINGSFSGSDAIALVKYIAKILNMTNDISYVIKKRY